jgi:hypothetical protein
MPIDPKDLPKCEHCGSLAVSINLNFKSTKSHERPLDGLQVVEEIKIESISYHCPNYHYWREVIT